MHPDNSDFSLQTPKAKAAIITIKANLSITLLINLRTKSKSIPKITKATILRFSEISGESHSGREFAEIVSWIISGTYED